MAYQTTLQYEVASETRMHSIFFCCTFRTVLGCALYPLQYWIGERQEDKRFWAIVDRIQDKRWVLGLVHNNLANAKTNISLGFVNFLFEYLLAMSLEK